MIALTAIPGPIFLCAAANRGFLFLFNETLGHDVVIATVGFNANTTQFQSYCFMATNNLVHFNFNQSSRRDGLTKSACKREKTAGTGSFRKKREMILF